jgi:hypothetical protein
MIEGTTVIVPHPPQSPPSIAKFYIDNGYDPSTIKSLTESIEGHLKYNTIIVKQDDLGIYAVARWNIHGTVAHILDVAVRKDKRGDYILQEMITEGINKFPYATHIMFRRDLKNQGLTMLSIKKYKKEYQNGR